MNKNKINICQPGFNASCALCCGSHNYSNPIEEIEKIFSERNKNSINLINHTQKKGIPKKMSDAIQCPYVGYINSIDKTIGCLVYNSEKDMGVYLKKFFKCTCKIFSCHARDILSDEEILFAAKLTRDWFYYSLLINEIALLKKTFRQYKLAENVPNSAFESIKKIVVEKLNCGD